MEMLDAWYKSTKESSRIRGKLKIERIRTSGDWPKLKAKAAAIRHIAKFALVLAHKYDSGSEHDRIKVAVCQLLVQFYDLWNPTACF